MNGHIVQAHSFSVVMTSFAMMLMLMMTIMTMAKLVLVFAFDPTTYLAHIYHIYRIPHGKFSLYATVKDINIYSTLDTDKYIHVNIDLIVTSVA